MKVETREGLRPGDPCEYCGAPKGAGFTVLNFGLNLDIGMCSNDDCPGEAASPPQGEEKP